MKKIFKNKYIQFGLIILLIIFLFSVLFPKTKAASFFRGSFFTMTSGVERFFHRQGLGIKETFNKIAEVRGVRSERDQLLTQVRTLTEETSKLREFEYENKVLRNQLDLSRKSTELDLKAAEIIGRQVGGFSDVVLVDKGSKQGIAKNDPVVSGSFLVGKVKEVYANTAHVQFITAVESIVNGMLQRSRARGTVNGGIGYGLEMESIPKDTKIKDNELVLTSGLGGSFPKGLIIGKVEKITSGQGDILKKANLVTPVNFNSLEIIFIVKN